jgi:hypothetical protein
MNFILSISILSLCAAFQAWPGTNAPTAPAKEKIRWIVQKNSSLSIAGHTNVNKFSCGVAEYGEADTITCLNEGFRGENRGIPLRGALRIDIAGFDCSNRFMTSEFKKTLKYKDHPRLVITFVSLNKMPVFNSQAEMVKGWVDVELAGVSRRFEINYTSSKADAATLELVGNRQFGFSDFGLQPPQKMGGLIRVDDILNVRFMLCLRPI